jgi:Xaa-Pro aminopeptidase
MAWFVGGTRADRIRDAVTAAGLDALLALTPENAAYLTGRASAIASLWRVPGLVAAVVGAGGELAVAVGDSEVDAYPPHRFARFSYPLWIERLDLRSSDEPDPRRRIAAARPEGTVARPAQFDLDEVFAAIGRAVRAAAPAARRVGADLAHVPAASVDRLRRELADVDLVEANAILDDLRAIKDTAEIDALRLGAQLTVAGIGAARSALRPGLTAVGVMAAYQTAIWRQATTDSRFASLRRVEGLIAVGSDGEDSVGPGQTVKLDMQVNVGGYHSDVGRTFAIAPTAEQREVYTALRRALAAAEAVVRPGVALRDVFAAGIESMRAAGFASYSRGHLGHSVGLAPNFEEPPFIAADEPRPVVPNMVLSLELPYYLDGLGSFQLERMVLVTADGHVALDEFPFEFDVGPGG